MRKVTLSLALLLAALVALTGCGSGGHSPTEPGPILTSYKVTVVTATPLPVPTATQAIFTATVDPSTPGRWSWRVMGGAVGQDTGTEYRVSSSFSGTYTVIASFKDAAGNVTEGSAPFTVK